MDLIVKSPKFALSIKETYQDDVLVTKRMQEWWNGRHEGLKILWPLPAVWVRVPLPVLKMADNPKLPAIYNFRGWLL